MANILNATKYYIVKSYPGNQNNTPNFTVIIRARPKNHQSLIIFTINSFKIDAD
ncbi:hypothetical protein MGG_17826 [Pyricularia oryzae 70-15]|uniref:Uncharacterized protein n=3 Tax=Pyricularia oryzae TaxID=318829 RepID=G4NIC5_PYRO7|nr:uncharacterized protein MGG_17826 [Pyricularia oryzae 70-15]EHA47985.1 hypothetical protein MGG_17826 [Pyricularia oryzae 70-15]ELQ40677.1 hypothetical protein OOU_Y34scaffold00396g2 [Pyricularia oryzae Y34]